MRTSWIAVLLLGMGAAASAQESHLNLLDDTRLPASLAVPEETEQDKKDQTVVIEGDKLKDELPVGPYRRPVWTLHRMSPTTRIYLQVDPGEVEFEQWLDIRLRKKRTDPDDRVRMSHEFEFGLGDRFQLDLYLNTIFTRNAGRDATLSIRSWAAELRWALADWGVIPGNPTLYLEYIMWNNQPDGHGDAATSSIEPKLLLGGEIARGWHWGTNFFYEATFNDSVREMGVTGTVHRTIIDGTLSIGAATRFVYTSERAGGGIQRDRAREIYLGPSAQIRMAKVESEIEVNGVKTKITRAKAHLDLEPIFGLNGQSNRVHILIVFGWDF